MSADLFSDDGTSLLSTLLAISIAVFALLFLKGFFAPPEVNRHQHGGIANRNPPPNTNRNAAPQQTSTTPSATPSPSQQKRATIRSITISAPGVLLEERSPASFSEGATVIPSAIASLQAALIKSNTSGGGGGNSCITSITKSSSLLANANVYILCQVSDDIGEAAVRAAFEFSGIIGSKQGQIPSQRFLFCETEVGKMSLVRQIEPEVHIDGESSTVEQLKRFIPRLIEVKTPPVSLETATEAGGSSGKAVVENFQNALDRLL